VVTTISQASKDELRKWVGPLADKVVVVPDCVFEQFTYDPKPFNEESPVVLQVGTKWNKNVERVIEAVEALQPEGLTGRRGCRLEIVGTLRRDQETKSRVCETARGRAEGKPRDEKTEQSGDRGHEPMDKGAKGPKDSRPGAVRELGRLTDAELVEAYRRCDMVVFASLYEGFGLPILEAQAMGRPVVTSNFGAMSEAAGEGALLVDPYSVDAIRAAVIRIKNEPTLREDLIAAGLRNAAKFRADVVALRYADVYRGLVQASSTPQL
jgi:glycosyltransferase involved in cell wall biosynthesis